MTRLGLALLFATVSVACSYRAPLGDHLSVVPITPVNGAGTGTTAQPTLRWSATPAATRFEVQVDDSCQGPADCAFPSPEVDEHDVQGTSYTPASALPASTSTPLGRRYYWHVRGCAGDVCGVWSATRSIVVARSAGGLNTDVNGDGYADLLIGAPMSDVGAAQAGQAYVYLGGPTLSTTPALTIGGDRIGDALGSSLAMIGDVNGDGFGDFLVRTLGDEATLGRAPTPRALIFFGGPTLHTQPDVTLPGVDVDDEMGATAGIGDVNGDGYDDFAFAGTDADTAHQAILPQRVEIHFGGPTLSSSPDLTLFGATDSPDFFGSSLAGGGDVNGDGVPDLIVGSHQGTTGVRIYFGGAAMDDVPDVTLTSPMSGVADMFGESVAIPGDVNGDGYDDVLIGAPSSDAHPSPAGRAYLYFGGPTMHTTPDVTFSGSVEAELFGRTVAPAGDVDGDGFADVAILTRGVAAEDAIPGRTPTAGRVDIYRGGAAPSTIPVLTLPGGPATAAERSFAAMDLDGDSQPDFVIASWVTNYHGVGNAAIFRGQDDYAAADVTLSGVAGDAFGAPIAH